ncbi:MAG: hypothetical protein HY727_21350 [Candidatus Rokubacteria bacterium]|nr:hypothetical protein [Candidatus Rokubacteria bacterium]
MNPWIVLPTLAVLAVVFVMLPVGLAVYASYGRQKLVRCPETGGQAAVAVDRYRAGLGAALGTRLTRIRACSLWPGRQGCGQACRPLAEEATQDVGRAA